MRPGEISAACNGVLFLDELAEFATHVLDALRQPLEEGVVRVARAAATVTFPARFLLVAAMNPCPCGYGGRPGGCRCTDGARARYQRRLSGPLLDRFDLRVEVTRPSVADLLGDARSEPTAAVRARVLGARAWPSSAGCRTNAAIPVDRLDELAPLAPEAADVLAQALKSGRLSAGGCTASGGWPARSPTCRAPRAVITAAHVATALSLRSDAGGGHARRAGAVGMIDDRTGATPALLAGHPAWARGASRELVAAGRRARAGRRSAATRNADPIAVPPPTARPACEILLRDDPRTPSACAPTSSRRRCCSRGRPRRAGRHAGRHRRHPSLHRCRRRVRARARAASSPMPAWRSCRGWPSASTAPPTGACSRPVADRWAWSGAGLDVVYPSRHRELWAARARARACCSSEAPLGVRPGRVAVPGPQPDHRGAGRPPRRGRVPRRRRLDAHRARGRRPRRSR